MIQEGLVLHEKYVLNKSLGNGAYGLVWAALEITTKEKVAVKFNGTKHLRNNKYKKRQIFDENSLVDRYSAQQLHSIGYAHLDIKPDNILISSNNLNDAQSSIIHLIDFGISSKLSEGETMLKK
ncbi:isoform 2 of casein kinase i isoform delta [Stylonychia lemnae]|uniref:Isoform 2 of casein kinase i isoform delta n=1 Tax=Stylonychia lemnae TaxID=5949 RepID=A0A078AWI6_STYLE|nr:isoform 2 of casein kinase i isoform delta [Stylonychia lemnae]|eukprot:CDW85612.1 isoform 2 of casein kinase i isoform delta [Stylonychia lemnae]